MPRDDQGAHPISGQIAQFYAAHKPSLHRFLIGRLGNGRDAEDVVHETFTRLLAAGTAAVIENPMALLRTIAVNIVRDGLRSERFRRTQTQGLTEPILQAASEPDPEESASARQRLRLIRLAIDDLPPRCREVFLLHKMQGKSHSEVAAALGISRNMVEKHVIRAYAHLRAVLDRSDGTVVDKEPPPKA